MDEAARAGAPKGTDARWIWIIAAGATLGAIGVLAGAFGAHALKHILEPAQQATWGTAAQYQLVHAVVLIALAALVTTQAPSRWLRAAAVCWSIGIVLFSGSLYAWVLSGIRVFVALTPLGGILLVAGWLALLGWALGRRSA